MFNFGTYYIIKERKYLNDINVFPVADGDTGNNLLNTFRTISLETKVTDSFTDTLDSICKSALVGARGNSGVIFAQFVNGLQKSNGHGDKISLKDFITLVENSVVHTYNSLSNPVEGTMLTVMKEWSIKLKKLEKTDKSIKDIFNESYIHINSYLDETKKMLDILQEKNVVDSGALGFSLFVKGIASYYNKDDIDVEHYENVEILDQHKFEGEINYRYCTEGLVKSSSLDFVVLRKSLESLGDSLIIAEGKNRFRVHIHTNNPEQVFYLLKTYGEIESQKVDDMKLQMNLKNSDKKRVLVTDSIADISKEILDNNNVVVIPVNITIDNVSYLDKLSITNKILFGSIKESKEYPKTSTPSIKYINDLFSRLLLTAEEIIVLTVSKKLTATYSIILGEAKKLQNKGKKIYVVDSYSNSATEGLLVKEAVNLLNKNIPTKSIIMKLEEDRLKTEILVCLETFKYATLSGRLPRVIGKIGMFLKLRPIMTLKEGKGSAFGLSFSQKGLTKRIIRFVKHDLENTGIKEYSIVHCQNIDLANEYALLFTKLIGFAPAYITEISSATAIHSGLGTVAIGYIKN